MDDSFMYINSAQNLADGNGLRWLAGDGKLHPLIHFPPLFSIVLAAFEKFGLDAVFAARMVNALAFGFNIILCGLLIERFTHSQLLAILGGIIFLCSDVLIEAHSWAMSEPLFLSLYLGSLLMMVSYLKHPQRKWIIAAGVLLGLSFLTRYLGIALILAVMLTCLTAPSIPKSRRWKDLITFAVISLLPVILWVGYTILTIGSPTDRAFDFYLITSKQILRAFNTMLVWFIPGRLVNGHEILWLIALVVCGILLWLFGRKRIPPDEVAADLKTRYSLLLFLLFQFVCYIPTIFLSKSFFDPLTPLNNRILLPLLPILLVFLMLLLQFLWRNGNLIRKTGLVLCVFLLLGVYTYRATDIIPRLHENGLGFARKSMHTSPTMAALRTMPRTPLYSNSPYAITMWTGLPAYGIPTVDVLRQNMVDEDALLVIFDAVSLDLYDTDLTTLTQGLEKVAEYRDGTIYRLNTQ
ncbi:MAG: glycosyltransferase family 39 protein [Anaerolineaceae bacterium]